MGPRVEIELRLKGMELVMEQALLGEVETIKKDVAEALKKAVAEFNFDDFVRGWVFHMLEHELGQVLEHLTEDEIGKINERVRAAIRVALLDEEKA